MGPTKFIVGDVVSYMVDGRENIGVVVNVTDLDCWLKWIDADPRYYFHHGYGDMYIQHELLTKITYAEGIRAQLHPEI